MDFFFGGGARSVCRHYVMQNTIYEHVTNLQYYMWPQTSRSRPRCAYPSFCAHWRKIRENVAASLTCCSIIHLQVVLWTLIVSQVRPKQRKPLQTSVVDPDPDPQDPHVFGPPGSGSGSTSQMFGSGSGSCSGSGSFYHHAKIVRKTLIPTFLLLFLTFYLGKSYIYLASKSNKQKKLY